MTNQEFLQIYKNKIINGLIEKKDNLIKDIEEIATYIDTSHNDYILTPYEIKEMNKKRQEILFIYNLISKIEDIKEV